MHKNSGNIISTITSPLNGKIYPIEELPDPAFACGLIGSGVGIKPRTGEVFAPEDGIILSLFDTKHAIVIESGPGIKILLHVGIGTMKLQGAGFEPCVATGDSVKRGDLLMKFDRSYIRQTAESMVSPVIVTNLKSNYSLQNVAKGKVSAGDVIYEIIRND